MVAESEAIFGFVEIVSPESMNRCMFPVFVRQYNIPLCSTHNNLMTCSETSSKWTSS